jgi:hypothetical protein
MHAHDAISVPQVVCEIVEVAWSIGYNVREVSASQAKWMELAGTTGRDFWSGQMKVLRYYPSKLR